MNTLQWRTAGGARVRGEWILVCYRRFQTYEVVLVVVAAGRQEKQNTKGKRSIKRTVVMTQRWDISLISTTIWTATDRVKGMIARGIVVVVVVVVVIIRIDTERVKEGRGEEKEGKMVGVGVRDIKPGRSVVVVAIVVIITVRE